MLRVEASGATTVPRVGSGGGPAGDAAGWLARRVGGPRALRDLAGLVGLWLTLTVLAVHIELHERLDAWLHAHEPVELDELMTSGFLLSLAAVVFASRRMADMRALLRRHESDTARIHHLAHHDLLTGLPNRAAVAAQLSISVTDARRRGEPLAVLCLDLDRFKEVNDVFGHAAGDELLRRAAELIGGALRADDMLARLGGDEFVVLLPRCDASRASATAQRLVDALRAPLRLEAGTVEIGASVGVALFPEHATGPDALLRAADLALYAAKQDGRGCCRLFTLAMDQARRARHRLETELRAAIAEGRSIVVHFQPLHDLKAGRVCAFEALVRWHHPTRGLLPPSEFIPIAEQSGLIVPLGELVLRRACAEAARWPAPLAVAVNVSPIQFQTGDLVGAVQAALAESGLAPSRLELEVTETALLHDTERTLAILAELRKLGVATAMDDFGTGYSSLSYLRRFPFDKLKIDRSFVQDMADDEGAGIVEAIIALGHRLGMVTVGEGVETALQLDELSRSGCGQAQGYKIAAPIPAEAVAAWLGAQTAATQAAAAGPAMPEAPSGSVAAPLAGGGAGAPGRLSSAPT